MQPKNPLSNELIELLRTRGIVEARNPIRSQLHVYGDRIDIIGVYPLNLLDPDTPLFDEITVLLHLLPEKRYVVDDGIMSPLDPNRTLVYFATPLGAQHYRVHYYRPGLWERYIQTLREEDERDREFNRKLHEVPIDDSSLFSEYLSPDDQT